jgi:hypothetical protein
VLGFVPQLSSLQATSELVGAPHKRQDVVSLLTPNFRLNPIQETEIESLIVAAGGTRAHPDADKRTTKGADFVLGSCVIELKILQDEGLQKVERQKKLARLFRDRAPDRPTIVIDRASLNADEQRTYDRIIEGPVKTAIRSARVQLRETKRELDMDITILWIINDGYRAFNNKSLLELVARRARNDSNEIDAVIVSGPYFYSDGFDSTFLWPMEYQPIRIDKSFAELDRLRSAWNAFATKRMNSMILDPPNLKTGNGPIADVTFRLDGVTYVLPSPRMGSHSGYFINGRPRLNTSGITECPKVATVFAALSQSEWLKFKKHRPNLVETNTFEDWRRLQDRANKSTVLRPFVAMPVTYDGWRSWLRAQKVGTTISVHEYATSLFQERTMKIILSSKEFRKIAILPSRYLLLITEEIGQDKSLDVSHLIEVFAALDEDAENDRVDEVWTNRNIFFEHALAAAAAEAVVRGIEFVLWEKDLTYAWI